eukprot:5033095-Amphidinium_carterae.1
MPAYQCDSERKNPIDSSARYCTRIKEEHREDCGWPGITEELCEDRGCCWGDDAELGDEIPRCFCSMKVVYTPHKSMEAYDSDEGCLRDDSQMDTDLFVTHFHMIAANLSGWHAIRNDDSWVDGGVHLEFLEGHLCFSVNGASPVRQNFTYEFRVEEAFDITVVYNGFTSDVKLFVGGWLQEVLSYTTAPTLNIKPGYVGCWDSDGSGAISRKFEGRLTLDNIQDENRPMLMP